MGLLTDSNMCIDKTTFKDMLKRKINFVNINKKDPSIVYLSPNAQKDWIEIKQFNDMERRWNSWIDIKKSEPNCVFIGNTFNSPTLQTGNVYVNKYINDYNIRQDTSYYCALNIIQNIWYTLFGQIIKESEIAKVAGTTNPNGTDHKGIEKALNYLAEKYKVTISVEWKHFSDIGWNGVEKIYKSQNQAIGFHVLYKLKFGHYEVGYFINKSTNTIGIVNSLGNKDKNGTFLGYFEKRSFKEMLSYINGINQPSCLIVTKK
ncbi:MAG: hypothetical protein FWH29_02150 [Methanobrevibacter sp.]|nr:hypothetical protein [Methanobrevibacter sp.]